MIARIRETEAPPPPPPALLHARQIVAAALLPTGEKRPRPPRPSRRFRMWGLVGGLIILVALCAASLLGWL